MNWDPWVRTRAFLSLQRPLQSRTHLGSTRTKLVWKVLDRVEWWTSCLLTICNCTKWRPLFMFHPTYVSIAAQRTRAARMRTSDPSSRTRSQTCSRDAGIRELPRSLSIIGTGILTLRTLLVGKQWMKRVKNQCIVKTSVSGGLWSPRWSRLRWAWSVGFLSLSISRNTAMSTASPRRPPLKYPGSEKRKR